MFEEQEIRFEYLTIPAEFFEMGLSGVEVMVLAIIKAFSKAPKYCHASNAYLAHRLKISESTVTRAIAILKREGWVNEVSFDGRKRVIKCSDDLLGLCSELKSKRGKKYEPSQFD